ncbi:peptidyl-prolyl cis-trans isomerase A [Enterobacter cloacae]|uniref:Peptidyl-prolyl cis-trans isomerase A n=1 Tax=Enterobacter cloacae TaxID=550 RepID=A0A377LRD7_ENTCL|nr:peptidyl-prolyl cis-trans isomerase A [Enterobacter cloacae]
MLKSTLAAVAAVFALSAVSPAALAAKGDPHVLLTTSAGNIELELNSQKAPVSVKNFLDYVNSGFYKQHHLPPRDPRLYGAGRRFQRADAAETAESTDQKRSGTTAC